MTEKLVRDGNVAVIYSPGYGAGWSTWNSEYGQDAVFNARLAKAILGESGENVYIVAQEEFPDAFHGGIDQCKIKWVPQGTLFEIEEYDGYESVRFLDKNDWLIA